MAQEMAAEALIALTLTSLRCTLIVLTLASFAYQVCAECTAGCATDQAWVASVLWHGVTVELLKEGVLV
eukprot:1159766-Pelagomonas_calceolata.AAC.8